MQPVFAGVISQHDKFLADDAHRWKAYLRQFRDQRVEVIVRKLRSQRSLDQNAYIHAVPIPILAEHFGYTIPECKYVLMGECWGWKQLAGRDIPIKPSTAEMTVDECRYFIDWVIPWALTNHDVRIPLPNEVSL